LLQIRFKEIAEANNIERVLGYSKCRGPQDLKAADVVVVMVKKGGSGTKKPLKTFSIGCNLNQP